MTRPIPDDQLLLLEHAAEIFLGSRKHVSTLRGEINRGNLIVSKIGRSYWTTLTHLREMQAKCLVEAPVLGSGSTKSEEHGPSSTDGAAAARDSLLMKLDNLKSPSGNTSRRNTSSRIAQRRLSPTS